MSRTVVKPWVVTGLPCEADYSPEELSLLIATGAAWLSTLSGGRVGEFCTVEELYRPAGDGSCGFPYKDSNGDWRNGGIGGRQCCRIELERQPVQSITEVRVYGDVIDPSEYVVEGNTLLRVGACWPAVDECDEAPVEVDYCWGLKPDDTALAAMCELVCELGRACNGQECSIPGNAQTIVRQGVTVTRPDLMALLDNGLTGMPLVDTFVRVWNPNRLQRRSRVFSPDRAVKVG